MDERRYYGLDALRGAMMIMGIVLHAAMLYMAAPPPVLAVFGRGTSTYALDVVFHFIHAFRMPLFFVLSGFFTALLVQKRGIMGTYRNRAARILAPLLAAVVTVLPITLLFMVDFLIAARFGEHQLLPDRARMFELRRQLEALGAPVDEPGLAHLWFLYYLCYFYFLIPACAWLSRNRPAVDARLSALLRSPLGVLLMALWTAITLWPFHAAHLVGDLVLLRPHLPSLAYYASFFAFGYVLHARRETLAAHVEFMPWTGAAACLLFPLSLWLSGAEYASGATVDPALHAATVVVHGLCTWALISFFIGIAQRRLDRESPWTLYASQSAYWVYLAHLPLVFLGAWLLVPLALPAGVEFVFVTAFTLAACFTTYHYGVQNTFIGRFLLGRRFDLDWPWRAPRRLGGR